MPLRIVSPTSIEIKSYSYHSMRGCQFLQFYFSSIWIQFQNTLKARLQYSMMLAGRCKNEQASNFYLAECTGRQNKSTMHKMFLLLRCDDMGTFGKKKIALLLKIHQIYWLEIQSFKRPEWVRTWQSGYLLYDNLLTSPPLKK